MAADLSQLRSLLFAPADDEAKLRKALATDADAVVADLEDAVAPPDKDAAREVVRRVFADAARPLRVIRVNGADKPWFRDDVALVGELEPAAIVLPKATPDAVAALPADVPPVVAIAESAAGVREAYETASDPRVHVLLLGAVDLGTEVGLEPRPDQLEIVYARSKVVIDSAAAGIRPPLDIVHLDVRDNAGLEEECRLARSFGFRGKACIHPSQVPIVNRLFAPSDDEIAWARKIVGAFDSQQAGVLAVDGTMVDLPVVERARRVLAEAKGER